MRIFLASVSAALTLLHGPSAVAQMTECKQIECSGRHIDCGKRNPLDKLDCEKRKTVWKGNCEAKKKACMAVEKAF